MPGPSDPGSGGVEEVAEAESDEAVTGETCAELEIHQSLANIESCEPRVPIAKADPSHLAFADQRK